MPGDDDRIRLRLLAARSARALLNNSPSNRGSRECRVRAAPAVSCAICAKKRTRAYRFSGGTPAFPAQWLDGLWRALPGDQDLFVAVAPRIRFCPPGRARNTSARLDANHEASGPHAFAVRFGAVRPACRIIAHGTNPP